MVPWGSPPNSSWKYKGDEHVKVLPLDALTSAGLYVWCSSASTQSSALHVRYINICRRDASYHLPCISLFFFFFCAGPPWSALAMPGSPCLYLGHRNNPEECFWQVYRRMPPFVVWADKPTLATLAACKQKQQQTGCPHIEDVIYVSVFRGPPDCLFFPFTVSGQLCKYRHHITHMLRVKFTLHSGGVQVERWWNGALFLSLHSSLSLSLQVGPDGEFEGRIDRGLLLWCQQKLRFVRNISLIFHGFTLHHFLHPICL